MNILRNQLCGHFLLSKTFLRIWCLFLLSNHKMYLGDIMHWTILYEIVKKNMKRPITNFYINIISGVATWSQQFVGIQKCPFGNFSPPPKSDVSLIHSIVSTFVRLHWRVGQCKEIISSGCQHRRINWSAESICRRAEQASSSSALCG